MSSNLRPIKYGVEVALAELHDCMQGKVHIKIFHRFQRVSSACGPGEEIWGIKLSFSQREAAVPLGLSLKLLFDYLARTQMPMSASQIAAGIRHSEFHRKHGLNGSTLQRRKIARSAIREYMKRIRIALNLALNEVGLPLDASRVLVSEPTIGNEILYRLKAKIEWIHLRIEE